jgi:hypothetical protein
VDLSGSGYGPVAGSCKHGNDPSVSIKVTTERLSTILKKPLRDI